jgi:hypothetical protein
VQGHVLFQRKSRSPLADTYPRPGRELAASGDVAPNGCRDLLEWGVRTHHEEGTPPAEPFRSSPRFGSDQNRESRATPKARPVTRSLRRGRPAETSVTLQNFVANYMLALTCSGSLNISFAPGFYVGGDLHWELGAEKWTILTWARQGRHVAAC